MLLNKEGIRFTISDVGHPYFKVYMRWQFSATATGMEISNAAFNKKCIFKYSSSCKGKFIFIPWAFRMAH